MDPLQPTFNAAQDWPLLKKSRLSELLDRSSLGTPTESATSNLGNWLSSGPPAPVTPPPFSPPVQPHSNSHAQPHLQPQMTQIPQGLAAVLPSLIRLIQEISSELSRSPNILLSLNRTRRDALVHHLSRLAGLAAPASGTELNLRLWVEGVLSPSQVEAIKVYREEVALICLGQAMLLKAWSDKGLRPIAQADLGRLNFALSSALKSHLPLHREGCLLTRPNLYSWFNPSPTLQREIWQLLESWPLKDEGPALLASALNLCRKAPAEGAEPKSFDSRFFHRIWGSMKQFGMDLDKPASGPIPRKRVFFSPTLRDGALLQTGPDQGHWIGLESDPFRLLSAELTCLWWGPSAPPLWDVGSGLEAHSREQLALDWNSAKPSVLSQISEMEACDLSFVLEERCVRLHQKSSAAGRFRQQLDSLAFFKKLRSPESSLGALQACVALSKLRPGGLLWWAREEPFSPREGHEVLRFLFDRARLVCEWDLSSVSHSLPTQQPLFSRYLYLFERDPEVERRRAHRPMSVKISGSIRSHVEVPLFLNDLLLSAKETVTPRGQWETVRHKSPSAQQDWPDHWPNSATHDSLQKLERLRENSMPLGQFATVRALTAGQLSAPSAELGISDTDQSSSFVLVIHASNPGVAGSAAHEPSEGRLLTLSTLDRAAGNPYESGFLIGLPNRDSVAPIRAFLESQAMREWLDCHAERRNLRWVLKESTVKYLPIPRLLLAYLGERARTGAPDVAVSGIVRDLESNPVAASESLRKISASASPETVPAVRAAVFAEAAICRQRLIESQKSLLSLVHGNGQIDWRALMRIIPKTECIQFPRHPSVRLVGSLTPHMPIDRIQRIQNPSVGIAFSTESGFRLEVRVDEAFLLELLWEQVGDLRHSTWSELASNIFLPRDSEMVRATASDILKSHGREQGRINELSRLLEAVSPTS